MIELTDGWYGIRGLLDRPLTTLLNSGKLVAGQKLCVYGAELVGTEQAVSPLEVPSQTVNPGYNPRPHPPPPLKCLPSGCRPIKL